MSSLRRGAKSALPLIMGSDPEKPLGFWWRSNQFFVIATVAVGMFTDLFLYGLIVPVLPFLLEDRVGVPKEQLQDHVDLLLALYAGASVIASPVAGFLADYSPSRQLPFLLGLFALLAATVLLALGQSVATLALARFLQGFSSGVVWAVGLALCVETVGPQNLGKVIGSIFSFISFGAFFAPLLGGALYSKTGITGVFGVGIGFIVVDFIMRLLMIERKVAAKYTKDSNDDRHPHGFDGQRDEGETDEESPLLPNGPNEDLSRYKLSEKQPWIIRKVPIIACLTDMSLLTSFLVAFVQAILLGSYDATVPIVAKQYYNFDSLKAGLMFLPLGLSDLLLGPLFGWLVDKYSPKPVALFAYIYLVPAQVVLRFTIPGGLKEVIMYGGLLAANGIGLAAIGAPGIVESGAVIDRYWRANPEFFGDQGPYSQMYGVSSMLFSAGLALGPLIAGTLKDRLGYGNMNAVLAGICALTAIMCFLFLGGKPRVMGNS